jgi:hypothetical protein
MIASLVAAVGGHSGGLGQKVMQILMIVQANGSGTGGQRFRFNLAITKSCDWLRDYMTNPTTPSRRKSPLRRRVELAINHRKPFTVSLVCQRARVLAGSV